MKKYKQRGAINNDVFWSMLKPPSIIVVEVLVHVEYGSSVLPSPIPVILLSLLDPVQKEPKSYGGTIPLRRHNSSSPEVLDRIAKSPIDEK